MSPLFIAVFTIHVVLLNIKCSQLSKKPEAWRNDAANSALITGVNYILNCYNISQYYWFYCIFDLINAALVNRHLLSKIIY